MNLLDENITIVQRIRLQNWQISFRHIGTDEARKGIQDDEIASLLRHRRDVTFFTQDNDFYKSRLCHLNCCIVLLNVPEAQAAEYVRKFLRHSAFQTQIPAAFCLPDAIPAHGNRCPCQSRRDSSLATARRNGRNNLVVMQRVEGKK